MGEVVELHETEIEKFIRNLYEFAEEGKIKSIIVAGTFSDGIKFTGQSMTNYDERKIHMANLHNDLIVRPFIEANYVTPRRR